MQEVVFPPSLIVLSHASVYYSASVLLIIVFSQLLTSLAWTPRCINLFTFLLHESLNLHFGVIICRCSYYAALKYDSFYHATEIQALALFLSTRLFIGDTLITRVSKRQYAGGPKSVLALNPGFSFRILSHSFGFFFKAARQKLEWKTWVGG